MNVRKKAYFSLLKASRGIDAGHYYELYWNEIQKGIPPNTIETLLIQMLDHCKANVPYYSRIMQELGNSYHEDPINYLERLPVLTKDIIRSNFLELQSKDIGKRNWYYMTSGGSTGEPGRVIQDSEFSERAGALPLLFSRLVGRDVGEPEVYLWGSEREIIKTGSNWKARFANRLTNSIFFNAFAMTPEKMLEAIEYINQKKPKLIIAYAEAIVGMAKFIEKENIPIEPQNAIITSAETLYPYMRELLERVFQCKVYNRYGSREIGSIACERPDCEGLWVAPWGNYIEILDPKGSRVPDGNEGEIIVTSLANFAMPLIRYRIDDRGILSPGNGHNSKQYGQVLQNVTGRVIAQFRTKTGMRVNPGYLCGLLFYKDWVKLNQIIQKDYSHIVFRIILADHANKPEQAELNEIISKTRLVFGEDCLVDFDFVPKIEASGSGKYHYTVCEVTE